MEGDLIVSPRLSIPGSELQFTYARSSGPGGQNVNKVNSKAVLRWRPSETAGLNGAVRERFIATYASRLTNDGDLVLSSQQSRDQPKNTQDCLNRLKAMVLAVATPPKTRRPTKPSRGSKERRLKEKKNAASKKENRKPPKMSD